MDDLTPPRGPVLVLAPHPDDESLGCGRLLSSLWHGGGQAHVAVVTDGSASHPGSRTHPPGRLARLRREETARAVGLLGGRVADVTHLDLPDAAAHRVHGPGHDLARSVAALVDRLGAGVLVAPSELDAHCDHEATAAAAARVAALRPGLRLLRYPVWSRWAGRGGALPVPHGTTIRIWRAGGTPDKRAAIHAHASQMGRVVRDAPDGFAMPEGFAEFFATEPELYFEGRS